MITAFYGTPLHVLSFQWNKFVDTVYTPSLFYTPAFFIFTREAWESLPEDIQAMVYDEDVEKIKREYLQKIHEADEEALKALVETGGINVVEISPEELAKIREKTMKVWETLPGDMFPQAILEEVKQHLKDFRSQNK
jgi:TRAP-type C4-dicarboxylate transport system substrate-binding protein